MAGGSAMSATATPVSSGSAAVATGGGGSGAQRTRRGRGSGPIGRRSTPGALRLILLILVALAAGWGALAAITVAQHAAGAAKVVTTSEPLSIEAQQIYSSLADADVAVSTGYLHGSQGSFSFEQEYNSDITTATADIEAATAASGGDSAIGPSLATLTSALPVYTGYVKSSQVYSSVGMPAGGSFVEVASEEMHLVLLPAARTVYNEENAQLTAASAEATGLPLAVIAIAAGLLAGWVAFRAQRWLSGRTKRRINQGLFIATLAGIAALVWLAVAMLVGRGDLLQATEHGSKPAETLAQADIGALQARGDEALNLISRTGDSDFQADIHAVQAGLGPQFSSAAAQSTPAGASLINEASHAANSWFAVNQQLHTLDLAFSYSAETSLAIGTGPGSAATSFNTLHTDLNKAITENQSVFTSNATSGQDAFNGLEVGIIVLAVIMALSCAWGLSRRLAEYR